MDAFEQMELQRCIQLWAPLELRICKFLVFSPKRFGFHQGTVGFVSPLGVSPQATRGSAENSGDPRGNSRETRGVKRFRLETSKLGTMARQCKCRKLVGGTFPPADPGGICFGCFERLRKCWENTGALDIVV